MELENYGNFPQDIPLIIEDEVFLYPFMIAPLFLENSQNLEAVEKAINDNQLVMVTVSKNGKENTRDDDSFYNVGVVGNIMRKVALPDGKIKVLFQGLAKGRITQFDVNNPLTITADLLSVKEHNEENVSSIINILIDQVKRLSRLNSKFPTDLIKTLEGF